MTPFRLDRVDLYVVVLALLAIPMFLAPLPWPLLVLMAVSQGAYWFIRFLQWKLSRS